MAPKIIFLAVKSSPSHTEGRLNLLCQSSSRPHLIQRNMSSFVRECKLRQSAVTVTKKDQHYENLKTFQLQSDVNGVTANSKFLAYVDTTGTGSAVAVLPHTSTGKNHVPISSPAYAQPIIRAHGQSVQDLEFNPFDRQQLYTCSTDKTIKLWQVPEDGLVVDLSAPTASLSLEDQAPVRGLALHPTVNGLLAARGSRSFSIFDVASGKVISSLVTRGSALPSADFFSVGWSGLGDYLVTLAKDKLLRIHDPRAAAEAVLSATAHTGLRFARSVCLGESPFLVTCGHSSGQERELMLWDSRNLAAGHLKRERIDSSYGPLIPLYDADLNALVIMGKGDNSLRLYDVDSLASSAEGMAVHALSNNTVTAGGSDMTKGACLLPKQANDLMACEVMRVLKLAEGVIEPISVTVPRKEKLKFHEDLFPPTVCEAPAAMSVEEYLAGENKPRPRVPLVPKAGRGATSTGTSPCPSPVRNGTTTQDGADLLDGEISRSRSESPVPGDAASSRASAVSKRFSSLTSGSKFRHMYGTENTKENSYFNLQPDLAAMDSPIVACSERYFAIPHRAGGGPVYVAPLSEFGKVEPDCAVVNGHKSAVQEIAFSPFHPGLMATGSNDGTVKVWDVSSCFQLQGAERAAALNSLEPSAALTTHTNSVRTVTFHPTVSGLLSSTSQDQTLRYFDAESGTEVSKMALPQVAVNVSYNYDGSLLAVAGKDRSLRIVDPRANSVVASTDSGTGTSPPPGSRASLSLSSHPSLGRNLRVAWCCTRTGAHADPLVTVSSGNNGLRQMHLWDPRNLQAPLITKSIDSASGQLFPLFDETMNTIFLAGKGDTVIRTYEMLFLDETTPPTPGLLPSMLEKSTDFQSSIEPIAGICMLPKRTCDVRNVEVARLLKLTTDALVPISFKVPRADHLKAYFHDDLFAPVRAARSLATVPDWESADSDLSVFQPILETLQPEGMPAISVSNPDPTPSTTRSKVDTFKQAIQQQAEENKQREDRFARLQQMAVQNAQYNRNLSGGTASAALQAANERAAATGAGTAGGTVTGASSATAFAGLSADRLQAGKLAVAAAAEEVDSDDNWDDDD